MPDEDPRLRPELGVTPDLISLARGEDELLLADASILKPLYVGRGREYITRFLGAVRDLRAAERITAAFPADVALLRLLVEHRIVGPADAAAHRGAPPLLPSDPRAAGSRNAMSLYLLLSQSCNLGCVYCLNGRRTYGTGGNLRMSEAVAFASVAKCLEALCPDGTLEIVFFGGEPLLNWELAKQVIRHAEGPLKQQHPDKRVRYHLTSNLALLPPDLIEWAHRHEITFLCDVDGPQPIHDACRPAKHGGPSHAAVAGNIGRLVAAGLPVSLRATITSHNQDAMLAIAAHHKELGGSASAFVPVNPVNSDEDILPESLLPSLETVMDGLARVYRSKLWDKAALFPFNVYVAHVYEGARNVVGCGAPYGNTPVVDVNGDVYPCIYLVGIRRFFLGNILSAAYPQPAVLDWMMGYLNVDTTAPCRGCEWRYICGGGCPVGRLTVFQNPRASDAIVRYCHGVSCDLTKRVVELLLWDMAEEAAAAAGSGA
ncbi:MAG TPA: radical SAM protein [Polyangia bacterium]|jgi:uncharacterized protein